MGRRHGRGPELDVREVLLDVAATLHEEGPPPGVAGDRGLAVEVGGHSDVDQVEDGGPEPGAGRPVVSVEMAGGAHGPASTPVRRFRSPRAAAR